jgi:hypothetical protein
VRFLKIFIFLLTIQNGFSQTTKLYEDFKSVEDSIAKKINPFNTLIYKTCEKNRAFYFIKNHSNWIGYFIKNLITDDLIPPSTVDTLKNGEIVKYKPHLTELSIFNADSLYQLLLINNIYSVQQISEDSIRARLIQKDNKKNLTFYRSLPERSHECNATIVIYGQKNEAVTYRGALIESEDLHFITTLRIFYITEQILINATKNYYR